MLITVSTIMLASQLAVVKVADDVPSFNIQRECRVDSASAFDLNAGLNATIKRCVSDEEAAKVQLEKNWSSFAAADRVMCTGMTVGEKGDDSSTPPSYVELMTCLNDQQYARKLPK
jgi:hypothetical protein